MAKKSDYSLFIIFFFNSLKNRIIHYFLRSHYSLFIIFGSLFTIHYKMGHYSLIIIPHPDPHAYVYVSNVITLTGLYYDCTQLRYFTSASSEDSDETALPLCLLKVFRSVVEVSNQDLDFKHHGRLKEGFFAYFDKCMYQLLYKVR